jgi:hypothetical protein
MVSKSGLIVGIVSVQSINIIIVSILMILLMISCFVKSEHFRYFQFSLWGLACVLPVLFISSLILGLNYDSQTYGTSSNKSITILLIIDAVFHFLTPFAAVIAVEMINKYLFPANGEYLKPTNIWLILSLILFYLVTAGTIGVSSTLIAKLRKDI